MQREGRPPPASSSFMTPAADSSQKGSPLRFCFPTISSRRLFRKNAPRDLWFLVLSCACLVFGRSRSFFGFFPTAVSARATQRTTQALFRTANHVYKSVRCSFCMRTCARVAQRAPERAPVHGLRVVSGGVRHELPVLLHGEARPHGQPAGSTGWCPSLAGGFLQLVSIPYR